MKWINSWRRSLLRLAAGGTLLVGLGAVAVADETAGEVVAQRGSDDAQPRRPARSSKRARRGRSSRRAPTGSTRIDAADRTHPDQMRAVPTRPDQMRAALKGARIDQVEHQADRAAAVPRDVALARGAAPESRPAGARRRAPEGRRPTGRGQSGGGALAIRPEGIDQQLQRLERKLDQVLRELDEGCAASAGAGGRARWAGIRHVAGSGMSGSGSSGSVRDSVRGRRLATQGRGDVTLVSLALVRQCARVVMREETTAAAGGPVHPPRAGEPTTMTMMTIAAATMAIGGGHSPVAIGVPAVAAEAQVDSLAADFPVAVSRAARAAAALAPAVSVDQAPALLPADSAPELTGGTTILLAAATLRAMVVAKHPSVATTRPASGLARTKRSRTSMRSEPGDHVARFARRTPAAILPAASSRQPGRSRYVCRRHGARPGRPHAGLSRDRPLSGIHGRHGPLSARPARPAAHELSPAGRDGAGPGFKQLIPYVIFRHRDAAGRRACFNTPAARGRARPACTPSGASASAGISRQDDAPATSAYDEGMRRELAEEVLIDTPYRRSSPA